MRAEPEGSACFPDYSTLDLNPDVRKWFNTVDTNHSGNINLKELQAALINAQGIQFSEEACRLMITLFDSNKNNTIDLKEFQHLYSYVNQWLVVFRTYDKDCSGYIEEAELVQALHQMGYQLSGDFVRILLDNTNTDTERRMSLDQFMVACVKIQRLTNAFRLRDKHMKGVISIGFEDFVVVVLDDFM